MHCCREELPSPVLVGLHSNSNGSKVITHIESFSADFSWCSLFCLIPPRQQPGTPRTHGGLLPSRAQGQDKPYPQPVPRGFEKKAREESKQLLRVGAGRSPRSSASLLESRVILSRCPCARPGASDWQNHPGSQARTRPYATRPSLHPESLIPAPEGWD